VRTRVVIDDCLGCPSRKITYPTRKAAVAARKWRKMDAGLKPYRCRHCALWHLGHSVKAGA